MSAILEEATAKVKEIAKIVEDMPAEVRELAFEFLLEQAFPERRLPPEIHPAPTDAAGEVAGVVDYGGQLARLAAEMDVSPEQLTQVLTVDEEGTHIIRRDLGADKPADRDRYATILLLWARRSLNQDIYVPRSDVVAQLKLLKLPTQNLNNNLKPEKCVKFVSLRGQPMFQLVGEWRERVREVITAIVGA